MIVKPFSSIQQCRYGVMIYNRFDTVIGKSLEVYHEFSEGEVAVFRHFVKKGHVVLDIGANLGAHTVFFGKKVGLKGEVHAFEPQRILYQMLCGNMALNNIVRGYCYLAAVGDHDGAVRVPQITPWETYNYGRLNVEDHEIGDDVELMTVDGIHFPQVDFIKIDVEGMEEQVLLGAESTIARSRPIIYTENNPGPRANSVIRLLDGMGYDIYWHYPLYFNQTNTAGNTTNIFGNLYSHNMLCLPRDRPGLENFGLAKVDVAKHQE